MRPLLLLVLLVVPALAGCAQGERQWAGVANAYQYDTFSLVEVQLHSTRVNQPGSAATAHAGMVALDRIEDAVANLTLPDGTVEVAITGWTFDRVNDTIVATIPYTGYDAFHMNATFVLQNGTRVSTHDQVRWHEEYRRPYHGVIDVDVRDGASTVTLTIYRVRDNATYFEYLGEGPEGTLSAANLSSVESWSLRIRGANGTSFEETAQPRMGKTSLAVTLPYTGIAQAEAEFAVRLQDGQLITQRDVDRDVYPVEVALARQRTQAN